MAETELKPACNCPFCGAFPEHNDLYAWCHGTAERPHEYVNLRISQWNRRTPDLRAGMEKAAEIADQLYQQWKHETGFQDMAVGAKSARDEIRQAAEEA